MDSTNNDSKAAIAKLREEHDASNDLGKHSELREHMAEIAGSVGEIGLDPDLD